MLKTVVTKNIISLIALLFFTIGNANFTFCQANGNYKNQGGVFCKKMASKKDYYLLLSCIAYSKQIKTKAMVMDQQLFLEIASEFQKSYSSSTNLDSTIAKFVNDHSTFNFMAPQVINDVTDFKEVYQIVENFIFSDIVSDDKVKPMKTLEVKLLKIPDLAHIYRLYISPKQDLSALSSTGGMALYIQIAYYIYFNNMQNRKNIIKQLL